MHHFFEAITNTDGQSLIGYFARVVNPTTQALVPIYSDNSGTPVSVISGVTNAAKTDDYGNLSLYVDPGTYNLDIYASDSTTFLFRVPNVAMNSTKGDTGEKGDPGDSGPADNTYLTLSAFKASDIGRKTASLVGVPGVPDGRFNWTLGNYTGQADDVNIIKAASTALSVGAWVRQKADGVAFTALGTGAVPSSVGAQLAFVVRPEQYGATGDGSNELTKLQAAVDAAATAGATLGISKRHYIVPPSVPGGRGLIIRSNMKIVFEGEGAIENLPHNLTRYEMLFLFDVENVEIVSPVLDGRRDLNAATTEEYGNGIQVLGACKNIRITDPVTNNMWGDGIFIGQDLFTTFAVPTNVTILRPRANNCRRQGMSITGGDNVAVDGALWTNTNGTLPAAGLDIEPDRADSILRNIVITNPTTRANAGSGILVYLAPLRSTSVPVSITISGHDGDGDGAVDGSGAQFKAPGLAGSYARGLIRYSGAVVKRAGVSGLLIEDWDARGPQIDIDRPTVTDPNERNINLPFVRAGISIWTGPTGDAATIGNVSIRNPTVTDTRTTPRTDRHIFIRNEKGVGLAEKIEIIDPVRLTGAVFGTLWVDAKARVSDSLRVASVNYTADIEIGTSNHADVYTNIGATQPVTWMLSQLYPVGAPEFEIFADGAFPIVILPDAASAIVPGGGAGKRVTVAVNSRVRLRRKNATTWVIVTSSGSLTFEP